VTPEEARSRFPVLDRIAYLNAGTNGPLSRATHEIMVEWQERALREGRAGGPYFEDAIAVRTRARDGIAALINVPADRVAMTGSTTEGCNLVITALRLEPDDEVLTTDAEHPGLELPLQASGAAVRVVPVLGRPAAEVVQALAEAVTPRTRLVALSHVLWLNGQVLPLAEIRRATGVPLLVDGAQSVGAVPVDASVADFYTVSGQKWLCGPQLTGALYVADPERLRPRIAGAGAAHAEGAGRLELGWHDPSAMAGLATAVEEVPEWAFARASDMAEHCRQALGAAGLPVHAPPEPGPLVSITPPGDPAEAVTRCYAHGVVVRSLSNGWLRASCGWWTSEGDVSRLVAALA
jgi:L-cysteine/cystine lyase